MARLSSAGKHSTMDISDTELVISELNKLYKNKEITGFSKDYEIFYMRLRDCLKEKDIEIGNFLRDNGFSYRERRTKSKDETLNDIIKEVEKKFGKDIKEMRNIIGDGHLYNKLSKYGKIMKKTPIEVLNSNGFQITAAATGLKSQNKYDIKILQELNELYKFNRAELASALGVSRERIRQQIKSKVRESNIWSTNKITEFEKTLIIDMCRKKEFLFNNEDIKFLRIYQIRKEHIAKSSKYAILIINTDNSIKYTKDLDKELINILDENGYDKYTKADFEVLKYMDNHPTSYTVEAETIDIVDSELKNLLKTRSSSKTNEIRGIENYVKFITGWKYKTKSERFKEIWAQTQEKTLELYKNEIKSHYVIENNKIFILQQDPLRNRVQVYAYKHNDKFNSFEDLVKHIGFEWVPAKQLPDWYTPYDFNENVESETLDLESEDLNKDEFIAKLKSIQGSAEVRSIKQEKVMRNQKLIKVLKKRYRYKCQFCNYEEGKYIPLIEINKNVYYMEGHHIVKISQAKNVCSEDIDIESIDTYKNAVICCPHHHRYIHFYHKSEFNELVKDKNHVLYLKNKDGDLLQIYNNSHLDLEDATLVQ